MRKLRFGTIMHHHEETSDDSKNGKEETSKISGATYCDGICDFERERSNYKIVKCCSKEKKSKPTRKLKMDFGSVDFTDDYHGPRHHLPKHN